MACCGAFFSVGSCWDHTPFHVLPKVGLKFPPQAQSRVTGSFHCQTELTESTLPEAPLPKKPPPHSSPLRARSWMHTNSLSLGT